MRTVSSSEQDEAKALDSGADDYVVKPFAIEELRARMRAALRRFRPDKRIVLVCGQRVHLTPKEFDVLRVLVNHQGKPITHQANENGLEARLRRRNGYSSRDNKATSHENRKRSGPSAQYLD